MWKEVLNSSQRKYTDYHKGGTVGLRSDCSAAKMEARCQIIDILKVLI